jgi:tetratricopeptide (TPR) repeat protein
MEILSAFSDGSPRSEALFKGLPAIVIATAGTLAVLMVSLGGQESLVDYYTAELQKTDNQRKILQADLQRSVISKNALATNGDKASLRKLKEEDPRSQEIAELNEQAGIYLNKLIKLQPQQREHKYRLANIAQESGDVRRYYEMLKQVAPLNAPGHPPAHLRLAVLFESAPTNSTIQRIANLDTALTHIEHCLTNDLNNLEALKIKARLLSLKGSKVEARETFEKVFAADPKYFLPLIQLQETEADRKTTLLAATSSFSQQLSSTEARKDSARWVSAWEGYFGSMVRLGQFAELEQRLLSEIDQYKSNTENLARLPFLRKNLADMYVWQSMREVGNPLATELLTFSEQDQLRMLDFYAKAYSYNENESTVLQSISRLGFSTFESVSEKAKQIYDPRSQRNLPSEVLNQLGQQALLDRDYKNAQRYYEQARSLSPNSPVVLNNLAYAYLKGEDEGNTSQNELLRKRKSNAERAHDLVSQAMRMLPPSQQNSRNMSRYRHTLGTALMQLKNYAAAVAELEKALAIRPDNVQLLESLIVCYDNFNLDSSPYRNKLQKVLADQN